MKGVSKDQITEGCLCYWREVFEIYFKDHSVQFSSVTQSCPIFATPWTTACQASLSITTSWSLLKLMSIELVMPSNHLILCPPLPLPPSIFPGIRVFSKESVLPIAWPKYWSFSFSISGSHWMMVTWEVNWPDLGSGKIPWQLMGCGQVLHYMILCTSASTALLALLVYIQANTIKGGAVNESLGQAELGFIPFLQFTSCMVLSTLFK